MKPKIFLSHSKRDQEFVKQLAADLRSARIDVWYDDWEIPPGASLRQKIFEDGIAGCDLFFVYLTPNSVGSQWVQQELNAAFVAEVEQKGGFLALFVDSDETRENLPLDLRSRRIPTLTDDSYVERLLELTALSWEAFARRRVVTVRDECRIRILELEKDLAQTELKMAKMQSHPSGDDSTILSELENVTLTYNNHRITLEDALNDMADSLAHCIHTQRVPNYVALSMGVIDNFLSYGNLSSQAQQKLESVAVSCAGKLIVLDIITIKDSEFGKEYQLTDTGKRIVRNLRAKRRS